MPASVSFSRSVLALTRDLGEGRASKDAAGLCVEANPVQELLTRASDNTPKGEPLSP